LIGALRQGNIIIISRNVKKPCAVDIWTNRNSISVAMATMSIYLLHFVNDLACSVNLFSTQEVGKVCVKCFGQFYCPSSGFYFCCSVTKSFVRNLANMNKFILFYIPGILRKI
jgi:hypothetical protein